VCSFSATVVMYDSYILLCTGVRLSVGWLSVRLPVVVRITVSDRVRVRDRVRFRDRDCRSEPDCQSKAINFGANSDCRSEPNAVHLQIALGDK